MGKPDASTTAGEIAADAIDSTLQKDLLGPEYLYSYKSEEAVPRGPNPASADPHIKAKFCMDIPKDSDNTSGAENCFV